MQNHSWSRDAALLDRPAGSAQNQKNQPNIVAAGQKFEPSMELSSTHHEDRSKTKKIKKILTSKTQVFLLNPNRKVEFQDQNPGGKKMGAVDINDHVSDYISRAKVRIRRTMTFVGGGKAKVEKEPPGGRSAKVEKEPPASSNRFTDYINRTKMKFRSTSNIGAGKTTSPKRGRIEN